MPHRLRIAVLGVLLVLLVAGCARHTPERPGFGSSWATDSKQGTGALYSRTLPEFLEVLKQIDGGESGADIAALNLVGDGSSVESLPLQDLMQRLYPYKSTAEWKDLLHPTVYEQCANGWLGVCRAQYIEGTRLHKRQLANIFAYVAKCDDHDFTLTSNIFVVIFFGPGDTVLVPPYIGPHRDEFPSEKRDKTTLCFVPKLVEGVVTKGATDAGAGMMMP